MGAVQSGQDRLPPPTGHVTLGQLQRIYTQSYARLSGRLLDTLSQSEAHRVVQEAFATAARTRFTFQTEQALIAWIAQAIDGGRTQLSDRVLSSTTCGEPNACDWDDVLIRASISTQAHYDTSPIAVASPIGRGQLRAILRGLLRRNPLLREASDESSGPPIARDP